MTTTTILTTLALSAIGLVAVQATTEFPLKDLLGLGSTGVALAMCILFLKEQREMRKEHAEVVVKSTNTFAATAERIHTETRASSERREAEMLAVIRESLKP